MLQVYIIISLVSAFLHRICVKKYVRASGLPFRSRRPKLDEFPPRIEIILELFPRTMRGRRLGRLRRPTSTRTWRLTALGSCSRRRRERDQRRCADPQHLLLIPHERIQLLISLPRRPMRVRRYGRRRRQRLIRVSVVVRRFQLRRRQLRLDEQRLFWSC